MREFQSIFATEIISYINRIRESGRTTACHEVHLGSLDRYLSIIGLPEKEINETTAVGWLKYRNAKPNYQANILSYYRGFANYLKAHGINAFVPNSPYTEHIYIPHIYTKEEISKLFYTCDSLIPRYKDNRSPLMMSMLLRILYCTGMRLREAVTLRVGQIDFDNGCILLLKAKNNRERWIPIHPQLNDMLKRYAVSMALFLKVESPLFPSPDGEFFTNAWAQYWFGIILSDAGLENTARVPHERGLCMHCFRHGYTYLALKQARQKGMTFEEAIPFISTYLGHRDISGTDYYMKFGYSLFDEEQDVFSAYTAGMFPEVDEDE